MPIKLKNSIFLHIPKTGGIKIGRMLNKFCDDCSYIGDPMYNAHSLVTGFDDMEFFCFVRRPAHFAHSLWHHRSIKKSNNKGKQWNWQPDALETTCKSIDYNQFMTNIHNNPRIVLRYYERYTHSRSKMMVGRIEHLANDLPWILEECNETFDTRLKENCNTITHKGKYQGQVSEAWIEKIEDSESELMATYYE